MLDLSSQFDDVCEYSDYKKSFAYTRRDPQNTLLYQIVDIHYNSFKECIDGGFGSGLPRHVKKEFNAFLKCGVLQHGFLRIKCDDCRHEKLVAFSCKKRGFCPSCGASRMAETAAFLVDDLLPNKPYRQWVISFPYHLRLLFATQPHLLTGALCIINRAIETAIINRAGFKKSEAKTGSVIFIQRFGSALNLNIHVHALYLDGVYCFTDKGPRFTAIKPFPQQRTEKILQAIAHRVTRYLVKHGALVASEDPECPNTHLAFEPDGELANLQGLSITYRIALGPNKGRKAYTLKEYGSIACEERGESGVPKYAGFSLHAHTSCKSSQRDKLERLCRYMARSALSDDRLSLSSNGQVIYSLKTPYSDGTTHVVLDPLDFISRLAALVPPPKQNLTRYYGLFATASKQRSVIMLNQPKHKKAKKRNKGKCKETKKRKERLTWSQKLARVFDIDRAAFRVSTCPNCSGKMSVIACIKDQDAAGEA